MSWLGVCLPRLPLDAQLRGCSEALEGQVDLAICDHQVVVLASDAALERGVHPGMPKATAQALSPDLLLKPRDLRREHDALKQAACWALQFTPRVSLQFPSPDARHGHESLIVCRRDGTPEEKVFPVTDIERAELTAFAAAVAGGPAYPLPVEDAIHGVAVYEAMIGAAASGSTYAVA